MTITPEIEAVLARHRAPPPNQTSNRRGEEPPRDDVPMPNGSEDYNLPPDDAERVPMDAPADNDANAKSSPPFVLFDQIEVIPKAWLADKFLGLAETSCWYGEPGSGKSVLAEDFGLHVAGGMTWLGREIKQGAVLYIALERAPLVKRRALAFKIKHKAKGLPFAIIEWHLRLP